MYVRLQAANMQTPRNSILGVKFILKCGLAIMKMESLSIFFLVFGLFGIQVTQSRLKNACLCVEIWTAIYLETIHVRYGAA